MNEYDLSDAITELLQGHSTKLSSKTALSVGEEMTQRTDESLDVDRRMPATTWTKHWVARNSRHVQRPQFANDNNTITVIHEKKHLISNEKTIKTSITNMSHTKR